MAFTTTREKRRRRARRAASMGEALRPPKRGLSRGESSIAKAPRISGLSGGSLGGGLDRLYAMNPSMRPGEGFDEGKAEAQAEHRKRLRKQARDVDVARIQGTQSEEAMLAARLAKAGVTAGVTPEGQGKQERAAQRRRVDKVKGLPETARSPLLGGDHNSGAAGAGLSMPGRVPASAARSLPVAQSVPEPIDQASAGDFARPLGKRKRERNMGTGLFRSPF